MLLKRGGGPWARTGKWKMGTKPNWNCSPISNFISNSMLCSHFSFSRSRARYPRPVPCFSIIYLNFFFSYLMQTFRAPRFSNIQFQINLSYTIVKIYVTLRSNQATKKNKSIIIIIIWLFKQNIGPARASHFLVHFIDVTTRLRNQTF